MEEVLSRQTKRMSLKSLCIAFAKSQGGWITLAAIVAIVMRLSLARLNSVDLILAVSVLVLWPLMEWIFHRFLMHEWTFLPLHFTHDRHHQIPTAATGLPDTWIVAMYYINTVAFWYFGLAHLATINVAVLMMLVVYEFVHFSCHCNYRPITSWGWKVRINHLQHHKFDETKGYSMLFPLGSLRK